MKLTLDRTGQDSEHYSLHVGSTYSNVFCITPQSCGSTKLNVQLIFLKLKEEGRGGGGGGGGGGGKGREKDVMCGPYLEFVLCI